MCALRRDRRKRNHHNRKGKRHHRRSLKINISVPKDAIVKIHISPSKGKDKNYHHLLFFKHDWNRNSRYSQLLRCTPYMIVYIEREALHDDTIHAQMRKGIPVPPESECKRAYLALKSAGILGNRHREVYDTVLQRLYVMIKIWSGRPGCAETVKALKTQRDLFKQFYHDHGYPPKLTKFNPHRRG